MTGKRFHRPAFPLLIAFGGGILLGEFRPGAEVCAWSAAGLALAWLIRDVASDAPRVLSPILLLALLGFLSIQQWVAPQFPTDHVVRYEGRSFKQIQGRVLTSPEIRGNRITFAMAVDSLAGEAGPVRGRIRVSSGQEGVPPLRPGDEVRFSGRIRKIRNFRNPGGFDYARFLAFQGIHCSAYIRKGSLEVLGSVPERGVQGVLSDTRERIRSRVFQENPGTTAGILSALLIGDKGHIDPELRDRFNRAGISHRLAISGLHIGSILALSYGVFRWLLAFVTPLLWHGLLRKAAALAALAPVLAYAALARWSPSTQRAVGMAAVVCLSLWCDRESDVGNSVALAALAILAVFPPALFSISFQLSFAAVGTLVGAMPLIARKEPREGGRIGHWTEKLRSFMGMSLFAVLGTLPLSMHYFNQVSFIGVIANLVYIPLVGCLVLPMGLLSVFLFALGVDQAGYGFRVCGFLLDAGLTMLPMFSELPFGSFFTVVPTGLEIGLYYAAGGGALWLLRSKGAGRAGAGRPWKKALILGGVILAAAAGDGIYWIHERWFREDLRITVIDVGQGSSALIEFPRGYRMLLDGGGFYDRSAFDVGAKVVGPFLRRRKILTLDAMVLSHPDSDHLNGLLAVADQFHVKTLWTNGVASGGESLRALVETAGRKGVAMPAFETLPRERRINGVDVEILYPLPGVGRGGKASADREAWREKTNNQSLVIGLRLGGVGILFPGDIEKAAEAALVDEMGARLRYQVLMAPHHGSRTSSSMPFLRRVSPEYVLVSAGRDNRFRCPHPEVLDRYRAIGARVLRTDTDGALVLETDGRRLAVRPAAGLR